jgi:hypothetical protein
MGFGLELGKTVAKTGANMLTGGIVGTITLFIILFFFIS